MNTPSSLNVNLDYQSATSPLGGSYTENKFRRLQLPALAGKRFLDLGCNNGYYCNYALQAGAAQVTGVDIDKAVIAQARQRYPKVQFFDGGWDAFPDGTFDVVVLLSAIHYAVDPVTVVNTIHQHLASDGLLVLEGGLLDSPGEWHTDCLVPGWRQVGDRCRHLSYGYVRKHLLPAFDWSIVGESEPRGGDDVPRYVIHARKSPLVARHPRHTVNLLEYAQGVAMSAKTVVDAQPAAPYVRALGSGSSGMTPELLRSVLTNSNWLELFMTDLRFALHPSKTLPVALVPVLDAALMSTIVKNLQANRFIAYLRH
jgi:SAM-dependent methyltransferase